MDTREEKLAEVRAALTEALTQPPPVKPAPPPPPATPMSSYAASEVDFGGDDDDVKMEDPALALEPSAPALAAPALGAVPEDSSITAPATVVPTPKVYPKGYRSGGRQGNGGPGFASRQSRAAFFKDPIVFIASVRVSAHALVGRCRPSDID